MKKQLLLFIFALLCVPLARGQATYPVSYAQGGNITSTNAACVPSACVGIGLPTPSAAVITVGVTGTFSATLAVEESQDGGTTFTSAGASLTTTGTTSYVIAGFTQFRVRASAYVSGNAGVNFSVSNAPTGGVTAGAGAPSGSCAANQLYVDNTTGNLYSCDAGTWILVTGGGAVGSIDPTSSTYGAKFDVHWGTQPTFTSGNNVVTCVDCNFKSTDALGRKYAVVGQIVWGTTATTDISTGTSTLTTPECLIQSVDSNTQIHMGTIGAIGTACNAIANTTGTGYLIWGDLDSASSTQTQSTANDPLFAAWTAASNTCAPLRLPAGATFVEQSEFVTFNVNQTCGGQNSQISMRFGYSIAGQGPFSTYIIPTPNFLASTCTGPNGTGSTCLFALQNPFLQGFQVFGGGNSACGAGFNGKTLSQIPGASPGLNMRAVNLMLFGWCANQTGTTGLRLGSGLSPSISGGDLYDVWVENYGINSVKSDPGSSGFIEWHGGDYWSANGIALEVASGTFKDNLSFDGGQTAGANTVQLDANTVGYFTDDLHQQPANGPDFNMLNGTTLYLKGHIQQNQSGSTGVFCVASDTCTVHLSGSQLLAGARAFFADTSATLTVFDDGGNTLSSTVTAGAGTIKQLGVAEAGCTTGCNYILGMGDVPALVGSSGTAAMTGINVGQFSLFYNSAYRKLGNALVRVTTSSAGGHFSVGVYSISGTTGTLIWSTGSQSTASATNISVTPTPVTLSAGTNYYMAWCADNTTALLQGWTNGGAAELFMGGAPAKTWGIDSTDTCTAGVLPNTITTTNLVTSNASSVAAVLATN